MIKYFQHKETGQLGGCHEVTKYAGVKNNVVCDPYQEIDYWKLINSSGLVECATKEEIESGHWQEVSKEKYMEIGTLKNYSFNT